MNLYAYNEEDLFLESPLLVDQYKNTVKNIITKTFIPTDKNTPFYKALRIANKDEALQEYNEYKRIADQIRGQFDDVVIVGMGGATLNPQSVLALRFNHTSKPNIHFIYNTDPIIFTKLKSTLDLKKTAFLVISNSGKTLETISITAAFINEYNNLPDIGKHFYFIIGSQESPLRDIASQIQSPIINHVEAICGRFATFSSITILPGLIAGLNMQDFLEGANITLQDFWQNQEESIPVKSAIALLAANKNIVVNLGYLQAFSPFLEWYCQILAESLGKNGHGYTPIRGIGPNDQHSMFQLYLDGPKDKLITFFYAQNLLTNLSEGEVYKDIATTYIAGKTLKEINDAEFKSTQATLKNRRLAFRTIMLESLNEKTLGALMAHCIVEVIVLGHLLEINPFDQPSVEEIKVIAQKILKESSD